MHDIFISHRRQDVQKTFELLVQLARDVDHVEPALQMWFYFQGLDSVRAFSRAPKFNCVWQELEPIHGGVWIKQAPQKCLQTWLAIFSQKNLQALDRALSAFQEKLKAIYSLRKAMAYLISLVNTLLRILLSLKPAPDIVVVQKPWFIFHGARPPKLTAAIPVCF